MPYTIRLRRDTAANWAGKTLSDGEVGYDSTNNQFRVGDGANVWGNLTPVGGGGGGSVATDTIWDAKGDLAIGSGPNTAARLAVGTNDYVLTADSSATYGVAWKAVAGGGTVTSVGLSLPAEFTVSNSPVTGSGTLTAVYATQTANLVFAGPSAGGAAAPTFRSLVASDIPSLTSIYQPLDATLTALAIVNVAADKLIYATGADAFSTTDLTSTARTLLDDTSISSMRTTLGFSTIDSRASSPISENVVKYVRAAEASLVKGHVVYISGSNGDNLNVTKAQANSEATSSKTVGLLLQNLSSVGDLGYIITQGLLENIDTSGKTAGDAVWLSPTTAGEWTTTKPTAPDHAVFLGWIVKVNASTGSIYIKVQNGYEIDELHNVYITSVDNNHMLVYDSTAGQTRWENKSPADTRTALGLGTLATQSGTFSGTSSGTNTGDQTITLTGDVTGSGTGSFATTIATVPISKGGTGQTTKTAAFDALSPQTTVGDLILHNGTNAVRLPVGATNNHVLTVDSSQATGVKWAAVTGGSGAPTDAQYVTLALNSTLTEERVLTAGNHITLTNGGANGNATLAWDYNPKLEYFEFADFNDTGVFRLTVSGTAAAATFTAAQGTPTVGVAAITTGTTTTGRANIGSGSQDCITLGTYKTIFEVRLLIPTAGDATDNFTADIGFFDTLTGASTDGCYMSYNYNVNAGDLSATTVSNGTSTGSADIDLNETIVSTTTYKVLRIEVNAAGTEVKYIVNGTTKHTETSNIPTGSSRQVGFGVNVRKSAGTAGRTCRIDYMWVKQEGATR